MRHSIAAFALAIPFVAVGAGCSEPAACANDGDCFAGESCIAGECLAADEDAGTDSGSADAGGDSGGQSDTGGAGDSGAVEDTGATEDTGSTADAALPACIVDPFEAQCTNDDEGQGEWGAGIYLRGDNSNWTCTDTDYSTSLDGRICYFEGGDYYRIPIMPCDERSFRFRVVLRPHQTCDPSAWSFPMRVNGLEFACDGQIYEGDFYRIECHRTAEQATWTVLVKQWASVWTTRYGVVSPEGANAQYDYTISAEAF